MLVNFLLSFNLFIIGVFGVILARKNLILVIMSLELMLLSININFIFFSIYTDTITGQLTSFFILAIGASESAVGLSLIVIYYKGYRYYY